MKSTASVTTIAIDLARDVFQLALADASWHIVRSLRLKRAEFLAFWASHAVVQVVMEACGSVHHFGRWLSAMGHRVTVLPAQYVRPYLRRNKTDKADWRQLERQLKSVANKEAQQWQVQRSGQRSTS